MQDNDVEKARTWEQADPAILRKQMLGKKSKIYLSLITSFISIWRLIEIW